MYSEKTIKRFTHPKFAKPLKNPDAEGMEGNMKCGDAMKIFLKVKDNKITDISFQTYGCVSAIASTDMVCEMAKGKTLEEAEKLKFDQVVEGLDGLPKIKYHCSVMGVLALKKAINDYRQKNQKVN